MKKQLRWRQRRSNPLCRRSDVIESWVNLATALALLLLLPAAAFTAGRAAHTAALQASKEQRASRHPVTAVLLENAPEAVPRPGGGTVHYDVKVRWTAAAGTTGTGAVQADAGSLRGSRTTVWLDRTGRQVPAPVAGEELTSMTLVGGALGVGCAAFAIVMVRGLVRRGADRRRMTEWERAWALTAPEWGRRPV
ncbi:hypothetical protein C8250_040700 [Streptomyces sp. So13.3]|uniref:Rv1733c family protein n=1 Tax=Streptomyces TaxID=1883 RepID=UPI0011068EFF|nr:MULTISPECIES: hypothetical protein [Streptomyces]MCZ4101545.1 hypothetical protein [Streptomyces sp. H39-C1]QNA77306.1 hypothetical protein C8250_040700 [Streptomyces sp. So13.3]